MLAAITLGASAYEVDDFVYTKTDKYQIADVNLVSNGKFTEGTSGTDGWLATDPAEAPLAQVFTMMQDGPNGSNTQKVLPGQTSLKAGMYQKVPVSMGGVYVVTLRVTGETAGITDLDLTGAATNYINAYFNTDGAFAYATGTKNKELKYGENGVSGGYGFSFQPGVFTEVSFAIEAPQEGFIMIDLRGLSEGMEIADVECHLANKVFDDRDAKRRLEYIKTYFSSFDLSTYEYYQDIQDQMAEIERCLENNVPADEMASQMENLELLWTEFTALNFSNVLNLIPTTDGSANTGNNSANWMDWTSKYSKLDGANYSGKAPWKFSTSRWAHNTASANTPIQIQWQRGATGNWDNIATLTATLNKGTYFWGMSAIGGMMTLNKERWKPSWAEECAQTQLFFNGDTTEVFLLDPAVTKDYVKMFEVTEDNTTLTLGIRCNPIVQKNGFQVKFYDPVLYQVLIEGELTPEQKSFLEAVRTQLDALKELLGTAQGYLAEDQKAMPWGKDSLAIANANAQSQYDGWAALTQDELLEKFANYEEVDKDIQKQGVNILKGSINWFVKFNVPFTQIPVAIANANATMEERIYSTSTMRQQLTAKIAETQNVYNEKLLVPFSSADSLALVNEKVALEEMVAAFKAATPSVNIIDIDFGTQEEPAVIVTHEDPEQMYETYYTIDGKKGTIKLGNTTGSSSYELGYNGTDSLGMLRVGKGTATIDVTDAAPMKESDIVNVKFDFYIGNLQDRYLGFKLLTEDGDTICGANFAVYASSKPRIEFSSFSDLDVSLFSRVGSSAAGNAAIAAKSNKTTFDIVLDYGARTMYCSTVSSKGSQITEAIAIPTLKPLKQLVIYSDYDNAGRRSFMDNIVINNIAADPTAVTEVGSDAAAVKNDAIYNIAGQRISAPAKGQIYIKNGEKAVY